MGAAGKPLIPLALAKMADDNPNTRYAAVWLVGRIAPDEAMRAAADVGKRATDPEGEVRRICGRVLEKIGRAGTPAAEALGTALAAEMEADIRDHFIEALLAMGAGAKPALPGLLPLMADTSLSAPIRAKIIAAVVAADRTSSAVAEALGKAAGDSNDAVRAAAAAALGTIDPLPADALAALVKMAKSDPKNTPRIAALRALTAAGTRAKAARSELEAIATGPQPGLALWAKVALAAIDGNAGKAAAEIRAGLGDRNPQARSSATEALLVIGPVKDDLPALLKTMKDLSSSTKAASATAVGRLGAVAKDAIPQLRRLLEDRDADVRGAAAEALGCIGPAAIPAVKRLKELRADPLVRAAAQRALEKIVGN
jgi:HEAT repeat protein